MPLDEFLQRNAHLFFDVAGLIHVAGDAIDLRADIVRTADAREPIRPTAQDRRRNRDRFHIVDRGRTAIDADIRRKRRLQARLAFLAFEAFEQRRLFAADVSAGAMMDVEIEIPTVDVVLADQLGFISLINRRLQVFALADEFAAHIDVTDVRAHRERRDQATFDEKMRIVTHDVAILAGARLGFVGVDDEIVRPFLHLFGHERPFEACREARAAAAAQARLLHLVDDRLGPALENGLRAVPGAARACARKAPIVEAVEVREDAVFVGEHQPNSFSVVAPPSGSDERRPFCGPAIGFCPRRNASRIFSAVGPSMSS